ncbi:hypothetical protein EVAR_92132_1 [Eumeta japonica]|uniref:Uncharacterized protein n=1 Tax=Eumeta variegata TaxID=151549 RepID=A0A4C1SZC1_EUMVA|nr:hypothetical protein EVAR_92132_1 [Eumeta japonica]
MRVVYTCYRPARALATSSVQYSNARRRGKERYTKVESRREKEIYIRQLIRAAWAPSALRRWTLLVIPDGAAAVVLTFSFQIAHRLPLDMKEEALFLTVRKFVPSSDKRTRAVRGRGSSADYITEDAPPAASAQPLPAAAARQITYITYCEYTYASPEETAGRLFAAHLIKIPDGANSQRRLKTSRPPRPPVEEKAQRLRLKKHRRSPFIPNPVIVGRDFLYDEKKLNR